MTVILDAGTAMLFWAMIVAGVVSFVVITLAGLAAEFGRDIFQRAPKHRARRGDSLPKKPLSR